jgi:hypothetical protein
VQDQCSQCRPPPATSTFPSRASCVAGAFVLSLRLIRKPHRGHAGVRRPSVHHPGAGNPAHGLGSVLDVAADYRAAGELVPVLRHRPSGVAERLPTAEEVGVVLRARILFQDAIAFAPALNTRPAMLKVPGPSTVTVDCGILPPSISLKRSTTWILSVCGVR